MKTLTSLLALLLLSTTLLAAATKPAESQPADKDKPEKQGTLIGKAATKSGEPVENADVFIYIRKPAPGSSLTKVAETKTKADGSFELTLDPNDNYTINILHKTTNSVWANTGIKIKAGETTDLGTLKISKPRM